MYSSFIRSRVRYVIVVLVAAACATPAAEARHAPAEHMTAIGPRHTVTGASGHGSGLMNWTASPIEIDRLGPKYVPLQHSIVPAPVTVVKIVRPGGFDWADGAVGAGVSGLAVASVAGVALLVTRRSRRPELREGGKLAR
jgi:hypothetical protein